MRALLILWLSCASLSAAMSPAFWKPYERAAGGVYFADDFNRAALDANWTLQSSAGVTIISNDVMQCVGALDVADFAFWNPLLTASEHWRMTWRQMFTATNGTSTGIYVGLRNRHSTSGANTRNWTAGLYGATDADYGKAHIMRYDGTTLNIVRKAPAGHIVTGFSGVWINCTFTRSNNLFSIAITNPVNASWSSTNFSYVYGESGNIGPVTSSWGVEVVGGTVLIDDLVVTLDRRVPVGLAIHGKSIDDGSSATNLSARYFTLLQTNLPAAWAIANNSANFNYTSNYVDQLNDLRMLHPARVWYMGPTDPIAGITSNIYWSNIVVCVNDMTPRGSRVWASLMTPNTTDYRSWNWGATNWLPGGPDPGWAVLVTNDFQIKPEFAIADAIHLNPTGMAVVATNYYNWWRR